MKIVISEFRQYEYSTDKEELKGYALEMTCKNEVEFMEVFEKIKDIEGVTPCGCPTIESNFYHDQIALFMKPRFTTNKELYDEINDLRKEVKKVLGQAA